jgi:hypothetical protein
MLNFIIGVLSSLVAVVLAWIFANFIFPEIKRRLFSDCPYIAGYYELVKMDYEDSKKEDEKASHKRMLIRQVGSKVWGYLYDESHQSKSRLKGQITGSRILDFTYEPENKNIHDYGTGMLKLSYDGNKLTGYVSFLCNHCEKITSSPVEMRKTIDLWEER